MLRYAPTERPTVERPTDVAGQAAAPAPQPLPAAPRAPTLTPQAPRLPVQPLTPSAVDAAPVLTVPRPPVDKSFLPPQGPHGTEVDGGMPAAPQLPEKVGETGLPVAPAAPQMPAAPVAPQAPTAVAPPANPVVSPPPALAPPPAPPAPVALPASAVPQATDVGGMAAVVPPPMLTVPETLPAPPVQTLGPPAVPADVGITAAPPGALVSEGLGLRPGGAEAPGAIGDPVATAPALGDSQAASILDVIRRMPRGPTDLPPTPGNNGINLSDFGEGFDLRGTQVNPTYTPQYDGLAADEISRARIDPSAPLAGTDLSVAESMLARQGREAEGVINSQAGAAQGLSDMARREAEGAKLGQYGGIAAGTYDPSRDANDTRSMAMRSLGMLSDTPDPRDLSAETFDLIQQRSAPQYERDLRSLTQREAAMGRQGSGMTDEALRRFALDRQTGLDLTKRELANAAAQQVLGNRTSIANTLLGATQAFGGEDRANAGFQQGLREEARGERGFQRETDLAGADLALKRSGVYSGLGSQAFGQGQDMAGLAATRAGLFGQNAAAQAEMARTHRADAESDRDYSTGVGQANAGLALSRAGAYQGLDADRLNREASMRDELRGEREYQSGQGQQNFSNQMARTSLQDYLTQSQFGRDKSVLDSMLGIGFGSNPTSTLLAASQGAQPAADGGGLGDLAALWAYLQQQQQGAGGGAPSTGNAPFPTSWA